MRVPHPICVYIRLSIPLYVSLHSCVCATVGMNNAKVAPALCKHRFLMEYQDLQIDTVGGLRVCTYV